MGSGRERSGMFNDFSRYSDKISLAAEREPFPVGIGDGGGAGRFNALVFRGRDMIWALIDGGGGS